MKTTIIGLFIIIMSALGSFAQNPATKSFTKAEQEIVNLSKDTYISGPGISPSPGVTLVWLNYLSENKRPFI